MMGTVGTIRRLAAHARKGVSWRDKKLAFLTASLGVIGLHRKRVRERFRKSIDASSREDQLCLNVRRGGRRISLKFRRNCEADYLVVGEFVRGSYAIPKNARPERIIDAGANIGTFSLHAAAKFPDAELICYEPEPTNFELLSQNLAENGISAEAKQKGVWSREETLFFTEGQSHTGFVSEKPNDAGRVECETPVIGDNGWLKLDAEGAEYEVLPAILKRGDFPKWISLEIHHFAERGQQLLTLLKKHGYKVEGGDDPDVDCCVIEATRNTES